MEHQPKTPSPVENDKLSVLGYTASGRPANILALALMVAVVGLVCAISILCYRHGLEVIALLGKFIA